VTSTFGIIERFANEAGKENPKFLHNKGLNVFAGREHGKDAIFSYGYHFPMAVLMPGEEGPRGWWLVNGDTASVSTSKHQGGVRSALQRTGLPMIIIPFSALREAGIDRDTIERVEVLPDRYTWEPRTRDESPKDWERSDTRYAKDWSETHDGKWAYMASVHHLGESLIKAAYTTREMGTYRDIRHPAAYFLSAFDENEPGRGLYFLCQLPDEAEPTTVAEAREALKPQAVKDAEALGETVLRQGDVFAIPTDAETRNLRAPSEHSAYVLNVNHKATEVRYDKRNLTYARGVLRHRPRETWRRPEHRAVKLGDGKTWYRLVKNTVPEGRSWSVGGNVD
jgi:hypothetical protein